MLNITRNQVISNEYFLQNLADSTTPIKILGITISQLPSYYKNETPSRMARFITSFANNYIVLTNSKRYSRLIQYQIKSISEEIEMHHTENWDYYYLNGTDSINQFVDLADGYLMIPADRIKEDSTINIEELKSKAPIYFYTSYPEDPGIVAVNNKYQNEDILSRVKKINKEYDARAMQAPKNGLK